MFTETELLLLSADLLSLVFLVIQMCKAKYTPTGRCSSSVVEQKTECNTSSFDNAECFRQFVKVVQRHGLCSRCASHTL